MDEPLPPGGAVIRVDKPTGPTSHDAVAAARRALRTRRIGHTGTLDPFASGLLLLCVGAATRLAEYLTALPKTYRATLRLGTVTDTDDLTGNPIRESAHVDVPSAALAAALGAQQGTIRQLPPLYSAKKVGGERMYAAARRGAAVERTPVEVTVHAIRLLDYDPPDAEFEVECSSGTYIRAIARDVGEALGVGAHLRALRRTRIGPHSVDGAAPLDRLGALRAGDDAWLTPAAALAHLPALSVSVDEVAALRHGRALPADDELRAAAPAATPLALLDEGGALVAVGERRGARVLPRKVLA